MFTLLLMEDKNKAKRKVLLLGAAQQDGDVAVRRLITLQGTVAEFHCEGCVAVIAVL